MKRRLRFLSITLVLLTIVASCLLISPGLHSTSAQQEIRLGTEAPRQIEAILDEKASRTPAQRKTESRLLYAIKERRGEALTNHEEVRSPRSATTAQSDKKGRVEVEIKGNVNKELIVLIEKLGAAPAPIQASSLAARPGSIPSNWPTRSRPSKVRMETGRWF